MLPPRGVGCVCVSEMFRYLLEIMYVQDGSTFRGIPTVMGGPLKLLAAFLVYELP